VGDAYLSGCYNGRQVRREFITDHSNRTCAMHRAANRNLPARRRCCAFRRHKTKTTYALPLKEREDARSRPFAETHCKFFRSSSFNFAPQTGG
jgi:hypothetical protein